MRLLLDTHALLWWLGESRRLPPRVVKAIADPDATIHVSAASAWEAATKARIGKLHLAFPAGDLEEQIVAAGFKPLPISFAHATRAGSYENDHRDPFDRLLAAQAELEDLVLMTNDRALAAFPCRTLW